MKTIPNFLTDIEADRIGRRIAENFGLQFADSSTLTRPIYRTPSGDFSNQGIARQAHGMLREDRDLFYPGGFEQKRAAADLRKSKAKATRGQASV